MSRRSRKTANGFRGKKKLSKEEELGVVFAVKNPNIQGKNPLPPEADDLALCEIFSCTPSELNNQDTLIIARMSQIYKLKLKHSE